jgi:hypothetical protein
MHQISIDLTAHLHSTGPLVGMISDRRPTVQPSSGVVLGMLVPLTASLNGVTLSR